MTRLNLVAFLKAKEGWAWMLRCIFPAILKSLILRLFMVVDADKAGVAPIISGQS
jgi:hypothetical protein